MVRTVSAETRHDLLQAVRERYRAGRKEEKRRILDEMAAVTGYHRKHVIRLLTTKRTTTSERRGGTRRLAGVRVEIEAREIAARYLRDDAMPAQEDHCGRTEFDKHLIPIVLFLRLRKADAAHAVADVERSTVRPSIDEFDREVRRRRRAAHA